ncbi:hypothetical protein BZA05DRAFT_432496 [Tricharina praecox]|uniref:uncharacterized protein n=1 Tax=Tricharina praecox TaxID=43433 RepID=UPI00221FB10D|nr:uncharacterized protein BZA05DRAFT_432496 [Tricharina praecox]KAI5858607.1 hypothetical protein BZA05DRAFT_432496 [Tricharina praecox]
MPIGNLLTSYSCIGKIIIIVNGRRPSGPSKATFRAFDVWKVKTNGPPRIWTDRGLLGVAPDAPQDATRHALRKPHRVVASLYGLFDIVRVAGCSFGGTNRMIPKPCLHTFDDVMILGQQQHSAAIPLVRKHPLCASEKGEQLPSLSYQRITPEHLMVDEELQKTIFSAVVNENQQKIMYQFMTFNSQLHKPTIGSNGKEEFNDGHPLGGGKRKPAEEHVSIHHLQLTTA